MEAKIFREKGVYFNDFCVQLDIVVNSWIPNSAKGMDAKGETLTQLGLEREYFVELVEKLENVDDNQIMETDQIDKFNYHIGQLATVTLSFTKFFVHVHQMEDRLKPYHEDATILSFLKIIRNRQGHIFLDSREHRVYNCICVHILVFSNQHADVQNLMLGRETTDHNQVLSILRRTPEYYC